MTSTRLPVNPNATPEARNLLAFLYEKQGKVTLSGQHNQMHHMSSVSDGIEVLTGKYPLVWGGEWGFSDARHPSDDICHRPQFLREIQRRHEEGRIVVVTYHQASPTLGEPCLFDPGVIKNLTDEEWDGVLTPGHSFYQTWEREVDRLGEALAGLRHIPIIFRPYHEMNGGWFWWGGDSARFLALWHMIFERFVRVHELHNLLWAWTPDKPLDGFEAFYPGHATVDLLGTDIYPNKDREDTYPQEWYDRMFALADGRPLALSEMSLLPTDEQLARQPWAWFMGWDNMIFEANSPEQLKAAYSSARVDSDPMPISVP